MDKQAILAVAGAGKTFYICSQIDPEKKNLILAFTNENIKNIRHELVKRFGAIPALTSILTFHSFVYNFLLRPYEPSILNYFGKNGFKSAGLTMADPPKPRVNGKPNYKYVKKEKFEHYIQNQFYYCATMSELLIEAKNNGQSLIKRAVKNLNMLFEQIFVDEFQDFRQYDYEVLEAIIKEFPNILLVGDFYQHSVSGKNNSGKPFKANKREIKYKEYKEKLSKLGLKIDTERLKNSRRCSKEICNYISKKLHIDIQSADINEGAVIWVDESHVQEILENSHIIKLVEKNSKNYSFNCINWSYSKGNTYEDTCVILTQKFNSMDDKEFNLDGISDLTINKLYVAMTRSKRNLYLVKLETFKKVSAQYCKAEESNFIDQI